MSVTGQKLNSKPASPRLSGHSSRHLLGAGSSLTAACPRGAASLSLVICYTCDKSFILRSAARRNSKRGLRASVPYRRKLLPRTRSFARPCPESKAQRGDLMGFPGTFGDLMGYIVYAFGLALAVLTIGFVGARAWNGFGSRTKHR